MIKHTKPFLGIDYDLLAITSLVINGKTKEVKLHHKIIYSYLLSLSGTYQKVTPSLKGIGERLGVGTDQTVRRHIKDLVSFGWLKIEERAGSTNAYIVLPYEQEAQTQQEATVKAVPDQLPPTEDKKTLETTRSIQQEKTELPWGGVTICKPNGQPTEAALEWALAETQGDNIEAYRLISIVVSEFTGREHIYTIPETEEDDFDIPF